MFKIIELVLLENNANVSVEYDENNDIYNLTLIEYEEVETTVTDTGSHTKHVHKNSTTVYIEKKDIKQIIKMLEYATFNDGYIENDY